MLVASSWRQTLAVVTDRAVLLSLAMADEVGALALRDLWREVSAVAAGREFTSAEILAHAATAANWRLRDALQAVCGEQVRVAVLTRVFKSWQGISIAGVVLDGLGKARNFTVWKFRPNIRRAAPHDDGSMGAMPTLGMPPCD